MPALAKKSKTDKQEAPPGGSLGETGASPPAQAPPDDKEASAPDHSSGQPPPGGWADVPPLSQEASPQVTKKEGKKAPKRPDKKVERAVIYPEVTVEVLKGETPLTEADADELLGWQEEPEGQDWGSDYDLLDLCKKKVRLTKNTFNRPLNRAWAERHAQEILTRTWRFNGEAIVIGQYGSTLSAQHRLVGFKLACQAWRGPEAARHRKVWHTPPTLESVVVFGVGEDEETVRTLDNTRPRNLADVLFTHPLLADFDRRGDRKAIAKGLDQAVKLLWVRTGAGEGALSLRQTHSLSLDFVERHPRLIKAAAHVYAEEAGGNVSRYVPPGLLVGLTYLMAATATDGARYRKAPSEKRIDWGPDNANWERAQEFVVLLTSGAEFKLLREELLSTDRLGPGGKATAAEQVALCLKAWGCLYNDVPPKKRDLALKYETDGEDRRHLIDRHVSVAGIDLGPDGTCGDDEEEDGTGE